MNSLINSRNYVFGLVFLMIFRFSDVIIYSSSNMKLNFVTLVTFLLPIVFAVYHINKDEEKLPSHVRIMGLIAATSFLFSQMINALMYWIIYFYGETSVYLIWDHRIIFFGLITGIIVLLNYININDNIFKNVIKWLYIATYAMIIMTTISLYTGEATMIVGDFGPKYLMEIFLPLLFLPFIKFPEKNLKFGLTFAGIFYSILVVSVTILSQFMYQHPIDDLFFNKYFIDFLYANFNTAMSMGILLLNTIPLVFFGIFFYFNVSNYATDDAHKKTHSPLIVSLLTMLFISVTTFFYAEDTFGLINVIHDIFLISQVALLAVVVALSFYLGFKKYIKAGFKVLLYVLSTFPIIYTLLYLAYIDSPLIIIFGEFIRSLNKVFLIFSAFVLLYYTLETISLWYAYNKRFDTDELEQTPVEKDLYIYVMIPCMNEDLVINSTVRSVLANDYPNLQVNVIDDASDDDTAKEVLKVKDSRLNLMQRIKPEAQQGKGEALNWAYYQLIKEIDAKNIPHEDVLITIIDADTDIDTDYFKKVNYVFNSRRTVTGLQSKVRVIDLENDSAQDLEFAEIINASQSLRNLTGTVAFGGNGQFCRLSTLESLDEKPWSDSLVEDFDLSTRLYLKNGKEIHNIQVNDIYIRQTGIKDDPMALVKQRVRWAQGNVQSFKYVKEIIKSKLLDKKQKTELISTLIKPWLMAIEYVILIYTLVLIADIYILDGLSQAIILVVVLFLIMALYILTINLVWAYLYNRQKPGKTKIKNIISDMYYLTKFLLTLTQIYPQSIIRFFKAENGWDKTKRQVKK